MANGAPKGKVLVADDDLNLRRILCLFLQGAKYQTMEARNGREALDIVRTQAPDLALLDVMMPLVDGFSACKQIKDNPATRHVPVIICTAKNRKEDLMAAIKAGAEDYIVKPFTKETVLAKVEKALAVANQQPISKVMAGVERRDSRRKSADWVLSWGKKTAASLTPIYKTKVYDISVRGLAFEFVRCDICTGYEQGTVHPLCLFAQHAKRFQESEIIDFVLSISKDIVFEVQGKVAHVFQWPDNPKAEKIGVMFTRVSPEAQQTIQRYLEGQLKL